MHGWAAALADPSMDMKDRFCLSWEDVDRDYSCTTDPLMAPHQLSTFMRDIVPQVAQSPASQIGTEKAHCTGTPRKRIGRLASSPEQFRTPMAEIQNVGDPWLKVKVDWGIDSFMSPARAFARSTSARSNSFERQLSTGASGSTGATGSGATNRMCLATMSPAPSSRTAAKVTQAHSLAELDKRTSNQSCSSVMSVPVSTPGTYFSRSPGSDFCHSPGRDYEIEEQIGQGGFASVHRVRDRRTDKVHAMKLIPNRATALREIQLMQAVHNPNVMGCFEVVNERNVVMDLMDYDLKKLILNQSVILPELQVKAIALQIMRGVSAIHQQGFIHRDITPSNVLINATSGVVKLSDFGISRVIGCSGHKLTPVCTTLVYRAPEGLHGARSYTESVDVWGVGCIIAEMFERRELFPGRSQFEMLELILQSWGNPTTETWKHLWKAISKHRSWVEVCDQPWMMICTGTPSAYLTLVPSASPLAREFLGRLLQLDPRVRPSAEIASTDEFFEPVQGSDEDSLELVRSIVNGLAESLDW